MQKIEISIVIQLTDSQVRKGSRSSVASTKLADILLRGVLRINGGLGEIII